MPSLKLSYSSLKTAAEKAKKKASADGFDRPLSFWQEFMAQSLGWNSFHHAGQAFDAAKLALDRSAPNAMILSAGESTPSPKGFPFQTVDDGAVLVEALRLAPGSFAANEISKLSFEIRRNILLPLAFSSERLRVSFIKSPSIFLKMAFDSLRVDDAPGGELLGRMGDQAMAYLSLFASFAGSVHKPLLDRAGVLSVYGADGGTLFESLASPWIDSGRRVAELLAMDPALSLFSVPMNQHVNPAVPSIQLSSPSSHSATQDGRTTRR